MMKRKISVLIGVALLIMTMLPTTVFAVQTIPQSSVEAPALKAISFENATIVEEFSPSTFEYTIKLDDPNKTPTLESYDISAGAQMFITKTLDKAGHQNGINVEVKNENVSANYLFEYVKDENQKITSNNLLESFDCEMGEVYPELNPDDTQYTLYVPSDLTELKLHATTQDITAVCAVPESIKLNADQNLQIDVTVTASDATTRVYTFQVKRIRKDTKQVQELMKSDDYTSMIKGELFYQRPEFLIAVASVAAGLVLVIIIAAVAKKKAIKVEDKEEFDFFGDKEE